MNKITELPEKWRDPHTYIPDGCECADELEAALPKWTRITDDKSTWPELHEDILLSTGEGFLEAGEWGVISIIGLSKYLDRYWRPLCDLDYPPTGEC